MSDEATLFLMLETLAAPFGSTHDGRPSSTWGELLAYGGGGDAGAGAMGLTASSQPNVFGGQSWQVGGHAIGYTTPNVFGGSDHHTPDGRIDYSTHPNVFGGFDVHHDGQVVGWSSSNVFGGTDVHDQGGLVVEHSIPGAHGVEWSGEVSAHAHHNVFGGTDIDFDPSGTF